MSSTTVCLVQGLRLTEARKRAGFKSARAAALAFGWAESSYRAHETGFRTIGIDDAERYASGFRNRGVEVTAKQIIFGEPSDAFVNESEDFARDHLEIRAWRLIQNRSTEELRRIIATIEAAFPREEGGDK